VDDDTSDYTNEKAFLTNARTYSWAHTSARSSPRSSTPGLILSWLHEHDTIPWKMYACMIPAGDRMYRWPGESWLPVGFSLEARRTG
jgi:hypothetical protein